MGEIKSVKVDNWGVFFLQKLQNFFNKTDYCDLTLQFRDNSQLKVHRLVLSACTDYFNVLEQTCEVVDDALIMPNELQADVVVPIVNFMYTGTLEFELKMYGKLLRTAKEMNMTVLLKLLEAHRRTMESVNRAQRPPSPKAIRRRVPVGIPTHPPTGQQIHRVESPGGTVVQKRAVQTKSTGTNVPTGMQVFRQQIGSTSVVRTSSLRPNQQTIQTYIKNEPEEYETITSTQPTSPFEQLRKGYNNNKRPAVTTFTSPPSKKPNLEDVKEFAEQQRMRKQIAAEYGDDQEFEGMMDDDIHNDDDDDDNLLGPSPQTSSVAGNTSSSEGIRSTSITFKHESDGQPPTIIVKDSSGSKLNHAKIISEVLRQYPHLAKGNKNIKLRVMPNATAQTQRAVVKKEPEQEAQQSIQQKSSLPSQLLSSQVTIRAADRVVSQGHQITSTKTVATSMQKLNTASPIAAADSSQQKRRIDSKTMHALIALGAENTTGPWLCLRCGVNGRPISIPSYRGFRRHLINTHKETIDPALCEHCGWRSRTNRELHYHMQIDHKIKTALYTFPDCSLCAELYLDTNALNQHMLDNHPSAHKQQCIYCNKIFIKEIQLYTHMKLYHKHQALEDGIIDASDEEFGGIPEDDSDEGEQMDVDSDQEMIKQTAERKESKVKIISDISLPMASSIVKLDSSDDIKRTLDAPTKFVTADGNEMILTEEQRKEIMSQLNQDHNNGGVVMVLQETIFPSGEVIPIETVTSVDEVSAGGVVVSEEELDDSQIYDELATEPVTVTSQNKIEKEVLREDGKEVLDNLEWAEDLITQQDLGENENDGPAKKGDENKSKKDNISQKLKELTGDWSDDENEEDTNDVLEQNENPDAESTEKTNCDVIESTTDSQMEELLGKSEKEESNNSAEDGIIASNKVSTSDGNEKVFPEQTAKSGTMDDIEKIEEDELDLAMQNLHEGDDAIEKKMDESIIAPDENIKMDIDDENIKKEIKTEETPPKKPSESGRLEQNIDTLSMPSVVLDQSTALLDELMATSDGGENLCGNKPKDVDEFDDAELNDIEEFSALDKSDKEPTTTTTTSSTKTTTTTATTTINVSTLKEIKPLSQENTKLQKAAAQEQETKNDKIGSSVVNETETTSAVTKTLSTDWEDLEDDDDVEEVDDDDLGDITANDGA